MSAGFLTAVPAEAGFVDRIKDIYEAPDKLEEIQSEYNQTKEELNRQAEQFAAEREELQQRTEALIGQNESLAEQNGTLADRNDTLASQNESLAAQNAALLERLEQAQRDKERKAALTRKIILTAVTIVGFGLAYFLSIRLWRFAAWRRHRRFAGGQSR
ncbi:hypothetical protein [Cohnella fermenti]|uniref:Uncharacterized protein n=1 Tax=Cohnella fermenti TaxID=2565925 RepID=A0A4S4BHA3_9BACL|nr:hypothetical protein [Cohnella fermenti]THF73306.1 hypothetical protein E6C55_29750 [Cohnella fermenti]